MIFGTITVCGKNCQLAPGSAPSEMNSSSFICQPKFAFAEEYIRVNKVPCANMDELLNTDSWSYRDGHIDPTGPSFLCLMHPHSLNLSYGSAYKAQTPGFTLIVS